MTLLRDVATATDTILVEDRGSGSGGSRDILFGECDYGRIPVALSPDGDVWRSYWTAVAVHGSGSYQVRVSLYL